MAKFRKKPVVIEAHQLTWPSRFDLSAWCNGEAPDNTSVILIKTLEGTMTAEMGDWVIKGVKGEFYPCKPDIFEATYEAVAV